MATSTLIVLGMVFLCTQALPSPPVARNTIFLDETLEGEIFENIDAVENIEYNNSPSDFRLPVTTRPNNYRVLWNVSLTNFEVLGRVEIDLVATQANVSEIVLHSNELNIQSVYLQLGAAQVPQTYILQEALQFLVVRPATVLQFNATNPIVYNLTIIFNAPLRNDMYGIYRSWFRNVPNAQTVNWMASTQFQATSARSAFPCYDEPSFKAVFSITIRRPVGFRSWSLTNAVTSTAPGWAGFEDDVYAATPVMSTYLLAIIVADYRSINISESNQLKYEVIARQAAIDAGQGAYALTTGEQLVIEMNKHTNIDYFSMHPQIKMTHAAVPDFSAGAMENWGLITYREAYLMYDLANTNDNFKQIIAYILSHEIAHMWFGNLVTCEFWDSLWLNEGFARYYQYYLTSWVERDMGFDTRFITEQVHTALLADSAESAHPLTNPNVGSPQSVSAMFSTISYNKGAAVIRMTEHLLGTNVHTAGLRLYLNNGRFNIARPIDLFQSLQNASLSAGALSAYGNFSLIEYYQSWTEQSGHPILKVQVNHTTGEMIITQRRFSINGGYANNNLNYIIPITFATASNPDFENLKPSHIIRNAVTIINRTSTGDQWVVFNKQQSGFYRVNYDDYTWDLIVMTLRGPNRTNIHEYNRAQIVNDVFQFARSGLMSYARAFNILSFLENETEYAPWVAAMTGFNWLRNRLIGRSDNLETQLLRIMSNWSQNVITRLSYYPLQNDTFMTSYLRSQLAPVLCSINVPACRQAANAQFQALVVNNTAVPPNSRSWVYCNGLRAGSVADYNAMWLRYNSIDVYTEKILLLQNLGCTPHRESLFTFLDNIFNDTYVIRPQDYSSAFNSAVSGNEGNTQIVFDYVKSNLQKVLAAFGSSSPLLTIASRLRSLAEISEFESWANQNQAALGNYYQGVLNSASATRQSIAWTNTVSGDLNNYFQTGDTAVTYSTTAAPAVTVPSTVNPPPLVQPESPNIPDSAATSVVSFMALLVAVVANIVV